jgi:hypothetical protein
MAFMSQKDFEKRTSVTFASRGDRLKAIGTALNAYNHAPTLDNLETLREALERWKAGHGNWRQDRRNTVKPNDRPIEELDNAIKTQFQEEARQALASAAKSLDHAYGPSMHAAYSRSMADTFINPKCSALTNPPPPLKCFIWYRENNQKAKTMFDRVLQSAGYDAARQGATDGLTLSYSAEMVNQQNAWLDQSLSTETRITVIGRTVTAGGGPPEDRIIQTNTLDHHTLSHEMLHWVTHADFADYAHTKITDQNMGKVIREGITEWLTRRALNAWNNGGYRDLVPVVVEVMNSGPITLDKLAEAYFRGKTVAEFCTAFAKAVNNTASYRTLQQEALKAMFKTA